ncbi:MAG TPA: DUF3443 family protein [Anaeromyxobacteraceae bacterium]|nr:DUF3443 family protein [Anaeromyxobacteraceae bacterium]
MRSNDLTLALALSALLAACGGGGGSPPATAPTASQPTPTPSPTPSPGPTPTPAPTGSDSNLLALSVDGSTCAAGSYLNKPCVSVTVCVPGTATCQSIGDLLLDTGSTGLRLFSQVLTLSLPAVTAGGQAVAECVSYLDGSSQWGPIAEADVVLGGEPPVRVPIQIIDGTYSARPSACANADPGPSAAGFNGILGVATFEQDCGPACTAAANGIYFTCSGSSCASAALAISSQVRNPVAALPVDNNGVAVRLPAIGAGGAASVEGALVLGIGTRANNTPLASTQAFPLDGVGEFRTTLAGVTLPAFADTGSNGLFFPAPSGVGLAACPAPANGWYCPSTTVTLTADNAGAQGPATDAVRFQIASIQALGAGVVVSAEVGGPLPAGTGFDWGLPFHLGRDVYVGFEGRRSPLGPGPFVAW